MKPKLFLWLFVVSVVFFLGTFLLSPRIDYSTDLLSYFKSLPVVYWFGLAGTLCGLLLSDKQSKIVAILFIVLLNCYIFGTPLLIYVNIPSSADVYMHSASAMYITKTGHLDGSGVEQYPGAYLFLSITCSVLGIDALQVARVYQFFVVLMISLIAYLIARRILDSLFALAPITVLSLFWFFGDHFGKESYSMVLYSVFFFLLVLFLQRNDPISEACLILVCFSSVIIHPLTSLMMIMILAGFLIIKRTSRLHSVSFGILTVLAPLTFWFLWYFMLSGSFVHNFLDLLNSTYTMLIKEAFNPSYSIQKYSSIYSNAYFDINLLRVFSGVFELFGGIIMALFVIFKLKPKNQTEIPFVSGMILSAVLFLMGTFRLTPALIYRPAEYGLLPFAILFPLFLNKLKSWKFQKTLQILLLSTIVVLVFAMPITRTSSMARTDLPTTSMRIGDFLVSELNRNISVEQINAPAILFRYYSYARVIANESLTDYYADFVSTASGGPGLYYYRTNLSAEVMQYRVLVSTDQYIVEDTYYKYDPSMRSFLNQFESTMNTNVYFDRIYSGSGDDSIYFKVG